MGVAIFYIPLILAEVKIPVIVVLTKYDLLVMEHLRACKNISSTPDRNLEAKKRAQRAFNEVTKELKVPFAPVSTLKKAQKDYGGQLISSLTNLFPSNNCYYRNDARGIDSGDAGQSAGCRRLIVGPLGHGSAN